MKRYIKSRNKDLFIIFFSPSPSSSQDFQSWYLVMTYGSIFFFLFWLPRGIRSCWARNQIQAALVIYAAAGAILDPYLSVLG